MKARARRVAATAVIAVGVGATGAVLAAPADAAQVVVGDCNATVSGAPGAPIALDLGAILGTGSGPLIPIGAIPQNGAKMLNASPLIKQNAGLLGGAVGALTKILSGGCEVTAKAVNTVAAPVQQAAKPVTDAAKPLTTPLAKGVDAAQAAIIHANPDNNPPAPAPAPTPAPGPAPTPAPGNGDNPTVPGGVPVYGQTGWGQAGIISPAALYSNIPLGAQGFSGVGFGVPGTNSAVPFGAQYANAIPGSAPSFGQLGTAPAPGASSDPVRTAGSAEALSTPQRDAGGVGLPLLLAVIALAGVAAALVRTWVLRRVSSS